MSPDELSSSYSSPWDEFRNHPGQIAYTKWMLLSQFYNDIVVRNGVLLINFAELPTTNRKYRKKLMQDVMSGAGTHDGELARVLYNYLASAASLADHCRRIMHDYAGTDFYVEYQRKLDKFKAIPEAIFLKELRNYFTHYKVPSIGYSVGSMENAPDLDIRSAGLIYTSDLDDYDKWSAHARAFILDEDHYPYVYVADVIDPHLEGLGELYGWLFGQFGRMHGSEYDSSLSIEERIVNGER